MIPAINTLARQILAHIDKQPNQHAYVCEIKLGSDAMRYDAIAALLQMNMLHQEACSKDGCSRRLLTLTPRGIAALGAKETEDAVIHD